MHQVTGVQGSPELPLLIFVIYRAYPPPPASYFLLATISSHCSVVNMEIPKTCEIVLVSRLDPVYRLRQCEREDRVGQKVEARTDHGSDALLTLGSGVCIVRQE